jgi:hypothetical protein
MNPKFKPLTYLEKTYMSMKTHDGVILALLSKAFSADEHSFD